MFFLLKSSSQVGFMTINGISVELYVYAISTLISMYLVLFEYQ